MSEDVRRIEMELAARNRAAGEIAGFNRSLNTTRQTAMRLGRSMLAMAGVGGGLYAIKQGLISCVREFASFEKNMVKVSTMLDESTMHLMPKFEKQIRGLAKQYGESTESLSGGLYGLLSAQIAPTKAMKLLETTTRSAIGGFTDAATITKLTTKILNAYGWQIEETDACVVATNIQHTLGTT